LEKYEYSILQLVPEYSYYTSKQGTSEAQDFTGEAKLFSLDGSLKQTTVYANGSPKQVSLTRNTISSSTLSIVSPKALGLSNSPCRLVVACNWTITCTEYNEMGIETGISIYGATTHTEVGQSCPRPNSYHPACEDWAFDGETKDIICDITQPGPPSIPVPVANQTVAPPNWMTQIDYAHAVAVVPAVTDPQEQPINPLLRIPCFTDRKIASAYQMTLYVDQPAPRHDDWISVNPLYLNVIPHPGQIWMAPSGRLFTVGHTFVGFQKFNRDGSVVTQVFGFYPPTGTGANTNTSKGAIYDNSGHHYNTSVTYIATQDQFNHALDLVAFDYNNAVYRLATGLGPEYNCTDAAINWMTRAGDQIPFSSPRGPFTNTPGDYGQVVLKMQRATRRNGYAPRSNAPCK